MKDSSEVKYTISLILIYTIICTLSLWFYLLFVVFIVLFSFIIHTIKWFSSQSSFFFFWWYNGPDA